MASKDALRDEIFQLRSIGSQMANICFNLGQKYIYPQDHTATTTTIDSYGLKTMYDLSRRWDEIVRREPTTK